MHVCFSKKQIMFKITKFCKQFELFKFYKQVLINVPFKSIKFMIVNNSCKTSLLITFIFQTNVGNFFLIIAIITQFYEHINYNMHLL